MIRINVLIVMCILLFSCRSHDKSRLNEEVLSSLGSKFKNEYLQAAEEFEAVISSDPENVEALLGLAETNVIIYIFGFSSREETLPAAREAFQKARMLDPLSSEVHKLSGIFSLLDWNWADAKASLEKAIETDPQNLNARHWYSLYLSAMGRFDEAMAQSDTISGMDPAGDYLIGRGSLLYFARRNEEMRDLMIKAVAMDTTVGWGYDWLGMAYIELQDYENSINTYYRAFELSDGTVEVGGGLGHALGLAGQYDVARQMADYYSAAAQNHYLPPVQRSFIHIGIGEYDEAIELLEQAYAEHSWFLVFIKVEPWYDPLRNDQRFNDIIDRMKFPK